MENLSTKIYNFYHLFQFFSQSEVPGFYCVKSTVFETQVHKIEMNHTFISERSESKILKKLNFLVSKLHFRSFKSLQKYF